MGKSLIITEKPSVAREFAKVLGVSGRQEGYIENETHVITWCVGHLVEMVYPEVYDERYKKWRLDDLPFLPQEYKYDVIPSVSKQYEIVHKMLHRNDIDTVYWAGDAGKEGQTIEENIRNFGGVREGMKELRVWIDSQTEEEILRGIKEAKPMSEYENLGKSGIMRTIEDYAMGINFSRAMSVKYGNLLNDAAGTASYTAIAVGRVMTCVLGMVVTREREIRNFKETPFYRVLGSFSPMQSGDVVQAEWKAVKGSKYFESPFLYKENGFKEEKTAKQLISEVTGRKAIVSSIEQGISKKKAPLLFNLAELQAECAKRFKISPDETLQAAQELYEKKLTTYPRTDARVLSTAVAKEIGKNIGGLKGYQPTTVFSQKIMAEGLYRNISKTHYVDDGKVTDHYAIIPTGQLTELKSLTSLQSAVFELIVRRFLSIFYPPAEYQTIKLTVEVEHSGENASYKEKFFASTKILKLSGYLEVANDKKLTNENEAEDKEQNSGSERAENKNLLLLAQRVKTGDELNVEGYEIKEGKTTPPKRYTSGSMVLAMENAGQLIEDEELRAQIKGSGIGTSATRAEIIKKLVRIGYLNLNKKSQVLSTENLGEMVYEVVNMTVPALLNPKMTASWEKGLDGITKGTIVMEEYRQKLEDFIRKETLSMVQNDLKQQVLQQIQPLAGKGARGIAAKKKLGLRCPICEGELETTPFGYGCSNYKKDGSGCKFSVGTIAGRDLSEEELKTLIEQGRTQVLSGFVSKAKKKFQAALVLEKDETGKVSIKFDFSENKPEVIKDVVCPICKGAIVKVPFGYVCENRNQDLETGCHFSIGKIAEKELSLAQVKQLLISGRTATIRGFKSKTGKRFDACLTLDKGEDGVVKGLKFDFEHVEAKKVKDVNCPLCNGEIVQTPFGFGCANYEKENPNSCRFSIGKIAGVKLKEAQVKELLLHKKTEVIKGFIAKTGMMFDAPLKLTEDGRVVFDFPEKPKPKETSVSCPKCKKMLKKSQWYYECECGYRLSHTVAKLMLSEEVMKELLTSGRTKEKVKGFTSKAGNLFDAYLKFDNDKISFDFNYQGNENESKANSEVVQNNVVEKHFDEKEQEDKKIGYNVNASQEDDFFAFYGGIAEEIAGYQEEEWQKQELAEWFLASENGFRNDTK